MNLTDNKKKCPTHIQVVYEEKLRSEYNRSLFSLENALSFLCPVYMKYAKVILQLPRIDQTESIILTLNSKEIFEIF